MNMKAPETDPQRFPLSGKIVSLLATVSSSIGNKLVSCSTAANALCSAGFAKSGRLPQFRYGDGIFHVARRCDSKVRFEFHDFRDSTLFPDDPAQAGLTIVVNLDRVGVGVANEENTPVPVRRVIAVGPVIRPATEHQALPSLHGQRNGITVVRLEFDLNQHIFFFFCEVGAADLSYGFQAQSTGIRWFRHCHREPSGK